MIPDFLHFAIDTEFKQSFKGIETLALSWYSHEFDTLGVFDKDELHEDFHPIIEILKLLNHDISYGYRSGLEDKLNKDWFKYKDKFKNKNFEAVKDDFFKLSVVAKKIDGINLSEISWNEKESKIKIENHIVNVELIFFFAFADLFRIFGSEQYKLLKGVELDQYRVIKVNGTLKEYFKINGCFYTFNYRLRDLRYSLPPIKGSLANQVKTFKADLNLEELASKSQNQEIKRLVELSTQKLELSEAIKKLDGRIYTEKFLKSNMDFVREKYPNIFSDYAKLDVLLTFALKISLTGLLSDVGKSLKLEDLELKETCGSNVQQILIKLMESHFKVSDDEDALMKKDMFANLLKTGSTRHLSCLKRQDYGYIPFQISGGLLFSRMVNHPIVKSNSLDLDLSSCYATSLCNMNLYIGEPITFTLTSKNVKLKDIIHYFDDKPIDSWFVRVSGKLKNAVNTLLINCEEFDGDTIYNNSTKFAFPKDINLDKETLNDINASKTKDPNSISKIYSKEINHAVFNYPSWLGIQDLTEDWIDEYLNLNVDFICYYPEKLMTDNLEEYWGLKNELSEKNDRFNDTVIEKDGFLLPIYTGDITCNNVSLRFPIHKYYKDIKTLRSQYKKDKNPIQEIFKLILNSTFGTLASLVMRINNPIAANWITACARTAAWRMTNALNGYNPITDGTGFAWEHIPFDRSFKELINENPNYLTKFDQNIKNNLPLPNIVNSFDFNDIFKRHLIKFIGKNDFLTDLFDYELKDEDGSFVYKAHISWNAGNYIKVDENSKKLKMRSYQKSDELSKIIQDLLTKEYKPILIYADKSVVKLSQGTMDADYIFKEACKVGNNQENAQNYPKMPLNFAEKIILGGEDDDGGLCHPMGFAKENIKIPKLITLSQFVYQTSEVRREFQRLLDECESISKSKSKSKSLIDEEFWKKLDKNHLQRKFKLLIDGNLGEIEIREDLDWMSYYRFLKDNPIGLGFELLCLGFENRKSISEVRDFLESAAIRMCEKNNFNLKTHINWTNRILPILKKNNELKYYLAAINIAKLNAIINYRESLINGVSDPMSYILYRDEYTTTSFKHKRKLDII